MKNICTRRNKWTVVIIHNMEPAVSNLWQLYIIVITNTLVSSVASLSLYVSIAKNSKSCFLDDVEKYNFEELNNSVIWKYLWLGQNEPYSIKEDWEFVLWLRWLWSKTNLIVLTWEICYCCMWTLLKQIFEEIFFG